MIQIGDKQINRKKWDSDEISNNDFWCPDKSAVPIWERYLDNIRKSGSSIGAIIEISATGVPVGLGSPVYDKIDADIAKAIMSINAVKAVEFGVGFAAAELRGEENADEMRIKDGQPIFTSNKSGGILGGITTGQDIIVRFAVKPTSSILTPRKTVNTLGQEVEVSTKGRHDPCVGIRAVPIGEAMVACVLADHMLINKALSPNS